MNKKLSSVLVLAAIGFVVVVLLSSQIFYTLKPGEVGVVFRKFGSGLDKENIKQAGFHVLAPWNALYVYDVREKNQEEHLDILDKSGLSIVADVFIRFRPKFDKIGHIHERFGENFMNTLVIPKIRASVREVMGHYTAEEIFATKRTEVENEIRRRIAESLGSEENNIELTDLGIRSIQLPKQIKDAIESKLQQEQEALAYEFKLQKEEAEAKRRKIAAEGEAAANMIINNSLTDKLLQMRAIEVTEKLVTSPNSKVILVGNGNDNLPVLLTGDNK
jgi:regulator of protease activity HflC (stomatin/prohibitin superfamily)